ncbi:ATP-binding protein [Bifidobacterium eulemuris]|uniref:GHKL domain-containing protein n=1 Tax=Bifidobacterium eulemuris TaxID=1765219 RepID=A0A261G2P2_9BIFI|nr:GHKL domain-containing protein [Bifidobacterium eulemuris]OZG65266.1 histidine kinase [Bifidobacterium eulemuris]QOL32318.1 GHKL domain-containing protein [Bifidobacterium eulemuris]
MSDLSVLNLDTVCTFFSSFRFVFTVLIAGWIFVRDIPKRRWYWWRLAACVMPGVALSMIHPIGLVYTSADGWTGISPFLFARLWIFLTFLWALLTIVCCRDISWTNAMSRWLLGVCVERFVTAFVHNWLFVVLLPQFSDQHPLAYMAICVVIYALFFALASRFVAPVFNRDIVPSGQEDWRLCVLYVVNYTILSAISGISMSVNERHVPNLLARIGSDEGLAVIQRFSATTAGVIAIVILVFQYTIYHITELQQESAMLNLLAEQKTKQYRTLSENIDFINHKTHDLKHQVAALEFAGDERRTQMVREVQQALNLYDSIANTGSEALDALVTERNFFCTQHDVRLSCMLGGCDWDAVDVVDLYTIIGNALDNAIDYVMRFDDADKRVVSASARQRGDLIVISVDNHFEGTVEMRDGLPVTTKADAASHGLGLKSIRHIARRYGGDILVAAEPPVFTVQISLVASRS